MLLVCGNDSALKAFEVQHPSARTAQFYINPMLCAVHIWSQAFSRSFEVDDALRLHMFPCSGLADIMQLAGTCRAWRQLIINIPMDQLPEEAQIAVLPSGLTSNLSLPQLVKQQAQLLARLRGKVGFTPTIQRLSLKKDFLDGSQTDNGQPSKLDLPQLPFSDVLWSPRACLEDCKPMASAQSS